MPHPDNDDFDAFVEGVMNASFSSGIDLEDIAEDMEEDIIIHNLSNSENENSEVEENVTGRPRVVQPSTSIIAPPRRARPLDDGWCCVTDYDNGPNHIIPIYNINNGPSLPSHFDAETRPIDYFLLFFNEKLMDHICTETNLFANKRKRESNSPHARLNQWFDVTQSEFKAFLGTIINMGLMPLPKLESYFSVQWNKRIAFYRDVFAKNRFLNIFYNLHFNHRNQDNQKQQKGFLIQPIVDHMKEMSKLFFTPGNYVAVDESTVSFKGKVSFRVYNKNKPNKFGLKIFVLSDCENGYIYDFIPYFGKQELIPNSNLLKTTQIVKSLTESVVLKDPGSPTSGLHVYTDRYYTSPELATELLNMKCFLTGTVMTNRTGLPPGLKQAQKKMKKGDMFSNRKGDTLVTSWRDKRVVTMLSTNNVGSKHHMIEVPSKWPSQPAIPKPQVVLDYTKHMGAVDRSDHFISSYQFLRKTKKWYRKMFFWLLEVAIVNSYILYKHQQTQYQNKPLSHADFRYSLIDNLVAEKISEPKQRKRGRQPQGPPQQRLDGKQHFMGRKPKAVRCVVCAKKGVRRETIYFCKTCDENPSLHPDDCYELYHTKVNF